MAADFQRIVIVKLGAIGGSLGLALKQARYGAKLVGIDDEETSRQALKMGVVDEVYASWQEGIEKADYIIISAESSETEDLFSKIIHDVPDGAIISDMMPVRRDICRNAAFEAQWEIDDPKYKKNQREISHIGFHPLIHVPEEGLSGAHPDLFINVPGLLTPTRRRDVDAYGKVKRLLEGIGARVFGMTPEAHDRLLAESLQLPTILAMAFLRHYVPGEFQKRPYSEVLNSNLLKFFQDVIGLDGHWYQELDANRENLIPAIRSLAEQLTTVAETLEKGEAETEVETGRQNAQQVLGKKGYHALVPSIWVSISDDSSSLSQIAEILSQARIIVDAVKKVKKDNGQNVQITFNNDEDAERANKRLKASGFSVKESF
jgi:prephenate dehydrogenase